MRRLSPLFVLAAVLLVGGIACTHQTAPMRVVKNDGTTVVGTIVDARPDHITVKTSAGETVTIPRADIASMTPDTPTKAGDRATATTDANAAGQRSRSRDGATQTARNVDVTANAGATGTGSPGGAASSVGNSGAGNRGRTSSGGTQSDSTNQQSDSATQRTSSDSAAGHGSHDATVSTGGTRTGTAAQTPVDRSGPSREITVPAGTRLALALRSTVDSATTRPESRVEAALTKPVIVAGTEVLPVGTEVDGIVVDATPARPLKGHAVVVLRFDSIRTARGQVAIRSVPVRREATMSAKREMKRAGIGAAIGGAFGAVVGHSKKALGVGAAAGAGGVAAHEAVVKGAEVHLPAGMALIVRLEEAVAIAAAGR